MAVGVTLTLCSCPVSGPVSTASFGSSQQSGFGAAEIDSGSSIQEIRFFFLLLLLLFFLCHSHIATQDLSHVHDLHHSSQQRWILNPPSRARDQTRILMDTCWIPTGTPMQEINLVQ